MARYKISGGARSKRKVARWKIVHAANVYARQFYGTYKLKGMKHLQWCAFICRQHKLVPASLLKEAGFK